MTGPERLVTPSDLDGFFTDLGLEDGMTVMVHSALKQLGYLINGPIDIVDALRQKLGVNGTLVMPSHTGQLTDPADWRSPPVPSAWVETIRAQMKPLSRWTPIRGRGMLADYLLTLPEVERSEHPISSIAALGRRARELTAAHPLDESEGLGSPYERLYESGYILLLGVGLERCTALHYAEFVADCPYLYETNVRVLDPSGVGNGRFRKLRKYPGSSELFPKIEAEMVEKGALRLLKVGEYPMRFFRFRDAVDLAVAHLKREPLYFRIP